MPRSYKWSLYLRFSHQNFVRIFLSPIRAAGLGHHSDKFLLTRVNSEALIMQVCIGGFTNQIPTYRKILSVNLPTTNVLTAELDLPFMPSLCELH